MKTGVSISECCSVCTPHFTSVITIFRATRVYCQIKWLFYRKKQTLKIISTCTSSVYSRKKRHFELSKSSCMSIITFSVHFLVRLFNFFLFLSIHPSIHLVSLFIHLVIFSFIYFIQLLVHINPSHFISFILNIYNSCMIYFYSVTCIQT